MGGVNATKYYWTPSDSMSIDDFVKKVSSCRVT